MLLCPKIAVYSSNCKVSSNSVSGTVSVVTKSEDTGADQPLSVATTTDSDDNTTVDCAKETEYVETTCLDTKTEHVETQPSSVNSPVETANAALSEERVETVPSSEDSPVETSSLTQSDKNVETSVSDETPASLNPKENNEIGADDIAADSSNANVMDTSMCDLAESNKLSPLSGSSDIDMEQDETYNKDRTLANNDNNSQNPADMDKTNEAGKDTTEDSSVSPVNLKTEETQTDVTKQNVVIKLQPLSDLDIDIWSNKVVQYHIFKADTSVEPPNTENNMAQDGYSLHECSKPKKNNENSLCP